MASSSDSQAKTISLVIFVLLTVVGGVTAYYFWSQTDVLTQQANDAKGKLTKANQDLASAKNDYEELRKRVGLEPPDNAKTVLDAADKELKTPDAGEDRKAKNPEYPHFSGAIKYLHAELKASDGRVRALEQETLNLRNELKATKEKYDIEVAKSKQALDDKTAELAGESAKFIAELNKKDEQVDQLRFESLDFRDMNEQLRRNLTTQKAEYDSNLAKQQAITEELRRQSDKRTETQFEHQDGKIVQVLRGGTEANIDLGLSDGVRIGLTFGIYGKDVGGNPYLLPKANCEVVRLLDSHRALVKVRDNEVTDPVVAGDLLYNPVWSPGDKESVAIIGKIYLDSDDEPDNDQFMKLIEDQGGKIDAWVDVKTGKLMGGDITVKTGWLVVGEIPEGGQENLRAEEVAVNKDIFKNSSILRGKAREAGVRQINIRNFLTYLGHQTPEATVASGKEYQYFYGKKREKIVDKLEEKSDKAKNKPRVFSNLPPSPPSNPRLNKVPPSNPRITRP